MVASVCTKWIGTCSKIFGSLLASAPIPARELEWAVSLLMTLATANGEGGIVGPHVHIVHIVRTALLCVNML